MISRPSKYPIIALISIVAVIVLPVSARAQDFRTWHAGALSVAAPENWQPPVVAAPGLAPLDLSGDDWNAALTDHPRAPDAGAMLVLLWSNDVPEEGQWPAAYNRARTVLAGHDALRIDWNDTEMGWTGFEIVIVDPGVGGKRFSLTCRSPSRVWSAIVTACERVAASVRFSEPAPQPSTAPSNIGPSAGQPAPSGASPPATSNPVQPVSVTEWLAGWLDPAAWNIATLIAASAALGAAIAGLAVLLVARSRTRPVPAPTPPPLAATVVIPPEPPRVEAPRFCTQCGSKIVAAGPCPKCGAAE